MADDDPRVRYCWAGRWAFLGGAWEHLRRNPCKLEPIHVIAAPGSPTPIRLCDPHFQETNAAGMVTEPFLDPDEFRRRRRHEGFDDA